MNSLAAPLSDLRSSYKEKQQQLLKKALVTMRDFSTNSRESAYIVEMFYHNKFLLYCQF